MISDKRRLKGDTGHEKEIVSDHLEVGCLRNHLPARAKKKGGLRPKMARCNIKETRIEEGREQRQEGVQTEEGIGLFIR